MGSLETAHVREAAAIARLAMDGLLATSNAEKAGRAGSDLRRMCGDVKAKAETYIAANVIADRLNACFAQAKLTGATRDEFMRLRETMVAEAATSLLAVLIKQACICFSLQQASLVLVEETFTSREDVVAAQSVMNDAFKASEEVAADEMALTVYQALIALHAAVMFHLYETARPLPQMLTYEFIAIRPTLVLSHRLYDDASRADELREENKIVHPAFAPRSGRALAF